MTCSSGDKKDKVSFLGKWADCGCGCNGKKQEKKFLISVMSALIFFIIANPTTFRVMRRIFGSWISTPNGCPSRNGLVFHTLVFFLVVWGIMNIPGSEGFMVMESPSPSIESKEVEEVEEVEELSNEGLSTIPEVQEEEISLSEQNTDIEKQTPILEEPITEVEEKSVSNDTSESEKDLGISKDDINSMTVAQLKEKLGEIGTPVTKGMKKKELRAILLAL